MDEGRELYACPPHRKRPEFVGTADIIPSRFPVAQKVPPRIGGTLFHAGW